MEYNSSHVLDTIARDDVQLTVVEVLADDKSYRDSPVKSKTSGRTFNSQVRLLSHLETIHPIQTTDKLSLSVTDGNAGEIVAIGCARSGSAGVLSGQERKRDSR